MAADSETITFADVIIPLALNQRYTYVVPQIMIAAVSPGKRVAVQFGAKRVYAAIVTEVHQKAPDYADVKEIIDVLDTEPVVNNTQLSLWNWISDYYMCPIGEVMNAALPAGFKLESETQIIFNSGFTAYQSLNTAERTALAFVENQKQVSVNDLNKLSNRKNSFPVVKSLLDKGAVMLEESMEQDYKPRTETFVSLHPQYRDESELGALLEKTGKAKKQYALLLAYLKLSGFDVSGDFREIRKKELVTEAAASAASYKALLEKEILVETEKEILKIIPDQQVKDLAVLNEMQASTLVQLRNTFSGKDVALLHGVTSSGKTEIYFHLIKECIDQGKQALYLLPEIALTTQMVNRLRTVFGNSVGVYHSRFSDRDRIEVWNNLLRNGDDSYKIIIGVRSSVFLPYRNLGLIIIDEEHENTYKQYDPAPRYHARDTAIMLATMHKAKVLLGSATPSVESFYNTMNGKYGLVSITERYQNIQLPEIRVVDVLKAGKKKQMHSHFSAALLTEIEKVLSRKKQVILFQNRRGFSVFMECAECGWIPQCRHCDVSLTYHKALNRLVCHYCGFNSKLIDTCGNCKSNDIRMKGFGTEKIEDEIAMFFRDAKVARLDLDSAGSRKAYEKILQDFEMGLTDILIGTQMISKGLDFDNVSLVGVLNADNMLNFPDFRAFERSYQLMAQVSGRAGRKDERGTVIIQTGNPEHTIIKDVVQNDYMKMFRQQLEERRQFRYPPFYRMIRLTIRNRDAQKCSQGAHALASDLKEKIGERVLGPDMPLIGRVQNFYLKNILIKIEKEQNISKMKSLIREVISRYQLKDKASVIHADVDPY